MSLVKTRFAPSPTGRLHIGNLRTALFSALYAKLHAGVFLLRVENTDEARSTPEHTQQLIDDLQWLGIDWQEGPQIGGHNGPYFQSERGEIYARSYQKLLTEKNLYKCFCSQAQLNMVRKLQEARGEPPRYPGTCRGLSEDEVAQKTAAGEPFVLRFRMPEGELIEFKDKVKGWQRFQSDDIGDFIVKRSDGTASFMFCNAIDDAMMGVTHVFRGDDHLTNTPRQLAILKALGLPTPEYAHLSTILGDDGAPLSKRHGSFSVGDLKQDGFMAEAILNYLARLGHRYPDNLLMDFNQLGKNFNISKLVSSPGRYDFHQLVYWQKQAVQAADHQHIEKWLRNNQVISDNYHNQDFYDIVRANVTFPAEAAHWYNIIFNDITITSEEAQTVLKNTPTQYFDLALAQFKLLGPDIKSIIKHIKDRLNIKGKSLFMPMRVAITGELGGPEMPLLFNMISPEKLVQRLSKAKKFCE